MFPIRATVVSFNRFIYEAIVNEYRVTKYDPALRGPNGEYKGDDWTSITQIGQSFRGVVLTEQEYKRVEHAYIKSVLAILSERGISALRVEVAWIGTVCAILLPSQCGAFVRSRLDETNSVHE